MAKITTQGNHLERPTHIPARMLNQYCYCPRLGVLEWVHGEFADNQFTEEGRYIHRKVDGTTGALPAPVEGEEEGVDGDWLGGDVALKKVTSVMLADDDAGIIAKMDLVEVEGHQVVPVDYKRSKKPQVPEGAHEPERVQLCAQAMVLRANGYQVDNGIIYYAGSRNRVSIPIDDELVGRTRSLIEEFRANAESGILPPPLVDSGKCDGCSLAGICLPDEVTLLKYEQAYGPEGGLVKEDLAGQIYTPHEECADVEEQSGDTAPRRLFPAKPDALPLYVQRHGVHIGKKQDRLVIKEKKEVLREVRLVDTSQVNLLGNIQISTQALSELFDANIPVCFFTGGGWFRGMAHGMGHKNVQLRMAQFEAARDPSRCLELAKFFILGKVGNCRTLLRRNALEVDSNVLKDLKGQVQKVEECQSLESLLGTEGNAARIYFGSFSKMLKPKADGLGFDFEHRNRRPPKDPTNALLSYAYAILAKELMVALTGVGFDPYLGFYHQPRYGRPALALDLMEEFRPLIADSVVLTVINNGIVSDSDFITTGQAVAMGSGGRRKFLEQYERRMDQLVTHPLFGYKISYRQVLEVQARLLGRYLTGEIQTYPAFRTR